MAYGVKALKIIAIGLACAVGVWVFSSAIHTAGLFVLLSRNSSLHQQRIQKATERMRSYRPSDWASLYEACTNLYSKLKPSNMAIETNEWPSEVVRLQPYYVWISDDSISMNWTGGFDDFILYMYAYRRNGDLNGSPCTPGIYIVDTRGRLPPHPYETASETRSQQKD